MDEKVNNKSEFRCKICNKDYASKSSLCNHNKKFHHNDVSKNIPNVSICVSKNIPNVSNNIIDRNTCK